ncbi:hypothetical protein [Amycolatopsis sp. RTGN1]|uniref:hypothetical protein n=1 Tax=Amycolatopsis ponsaeliensis TaxID=2992142 RepID=UPI00254C6638|nr:hypothetical protein [Amycolatopsis sp. RTGN1]
MIEVARPGDDVGAKVVPDGQIASLVGDHDTGVAVIQGTHRQLDALLRRAAQALDQVVEARGA